MAQFTPADHAKHKIRKFGGKSSFTQKRDLSGLRFALFSMTQDQREASLKKRWDRGLLRRTAKGFLAVIR